MKVRICILLILLAFSAYSQDTIPKKTPVLSIGIRNLYGVLPYNYCVGINTNNLKNNFSLAYNSFINTSFTENPGIQISYNHYFFKNKGLVIGTNFNYIFGEFGFAGERAKYDGYTFFKNLTYLEFNMGYYYRFKLYKFGVIEPSVTLSYFYPVRSLDKSYFDDSIIPRLIPHLEIKYYFKRNKK